MAARSNSPLICGPRWLCERRIRATPGIWARGQKFTHGQLYVAMSRIGCPEGVKLLVTDGWEDAREDAPVGVYTRNVVYTEVL